MKILLNKQCCLIASLQEKNYFQINIFRASGGKMEKNLKILLMKATKSLGDRAKEKIQNFINKSLFESHNVRMRDWVA